MTVCEFWHAQIERAHLRIDELVDQIGTGDDDSDQEALWAAAGRTQLRGKVLSGMQPPIAPAATAFPPPLPQDPAGEVPAPPVASPAAPGPPGIVFAALVDRYEEEHRPPADLKGVTSPHPEAGVAADPAPEPPLGEMGSSPGGGEAVQGSGDGGVEEDLTQPSQAGDLQGEAVGEGAAAAAVGGGAAAAAVVVALGGLGSGVWEEDLTQPSQGDPGVGEAVQAAAGDDLTQPSPAAEPLLAGVLVAGAPAEEEPAPISHFAPGEEPEAPHQVCPT